MFTRTVHGSERALRSVLTTKGSCVVGLVLADKISPSEEVWSDCYKGLRSGAEGAVYSSRYQDQGFRWAAVPLKGSVLGDCIKRF